MEINLWFRDKHAWKLPVPSTHPCTEHFLPIMNNSTLTRVVTNSVPFFLRNPLLGEPVRGEIWIVGSTSKWMIDRYLSMSGTNSQRKSSTFNWACQQWQRLNLVGAGYKRVQNSIETLIPAFRLHYPGVMLHIWRRAKVCWPKRMTDYSLVGCTGTLEYIIILFQMIFSRHISA